MAIVKTYAVLLLLSVVSYAFNPPGATISSFKNGLNNANAVCAAVNKEAGYLISICQTQI